MKRLISLICMIPCLAVGAESHPTTDCPFDGFGGKARLGETVAASEAYYACGVKTGCLSMKLRVGQRVVMFQISGDWICGYVQDRRGAAPAWVATKDVREIKPDPNPGVTAWLGTWNQNGNEIEMKPLKGSMNIILTGHAAWHGRGDVEHSGDLNGEVTPSGNHIHYSEGPGGCTLDLTLFGRYIVANDNNECGGMNVRFWGLWRRSS